MPWSTTWIRPSTSRTSRFGRGLRSSSDCGLPDGKDGVSSMVSARLRRQWPWLLMLGAVLAVGWWVIETQNPGSNEVAGLSADEFGKRVRGYLLEHPEVILESVQRLQDQQRVSAANQDQAMIAAHA